MVYPYNEILFNNKRNKVLIHATVSMDLKNIMPSEKSQHTQKTTYFETSFVSPAVKTLHLYCREHSFSLAELSMGCGGCNPQSLGWVAVLWRWLPATSQWGRGEKAWEMALHSVPGSTTNLPRSGDGFDGFVEKSS